ncbi:hypothetical protein [Catellatospora sp. NPDC049133]|jgi:hypothetical protein|uniref:hypothetical protein n=1 Tax=Catellatospora sp. NPDC049133 TaxID=3155499 RepID=UPI0033F3D9CC
MTTRLHRTARRAAHTALLSLALVTGAASAATAGMPVGLNRALQDLSTAASADVPIGGVIFDTAMVSGVATGVPGSLVFELYGPDDAECTGDIIFNPTVVTSGSGNFPSGDFTPTAPGTYRWIVRFSTGTETIVSGCNEAGEDTDVLQATPRVRTLASDDVPLGEPIFDRARLTGGYQPTGTLTFNLYGPGDDVCEEAPITTSPVTVNGNGPYRSASFTPTVPGTYRWRADYSGDANNAIAGTACNDELEQVTVRAVPTLATNVTDPEVDLGAAVSDTATLTGGLRATGTIVFTLYGPDDEDCATDPVFTSDEIAVDGDDTYESGDFTPDAAGTYRWIATYSGDAGNEEVATQCGDPNETVVVRGDQVTPVLTTRVSRGTTYLGKPVTDIATLSGGDDPTGTITFNLYGPGDATCSRTPVFTSVVDVTTGNGDYTSGEFRPRVPGTYQWVAEYSGDENNTGVVTDCGDPAEQFIVKKKPPYGGVPRP